jgi:D-alanine-D-alanine ligase-like ATP-grasp enzyme
MSDRTRLGVVFGGRSAEHDVSVVSAMELIAAADPARFETVPFGVTRDGRWLTPDETRAQLDRNDALFEKRIALDVPPLLERAAVLDALRRIDDDERRAIGVAGRRRILRRHSAAHRASEFERYVAEAGSTAAVRSYSRVSGDGVAADTSVP